MKETERHFFLCRGAVKLATVPKMMVSGRAQYEILDKLDFHEAGDDAKYDQAVQKVVRQRSLPGIPDVDRKG